MLKNRIISTLKFFDLQDCPLTLLELQKFLLNDVDILRQHLDTKFEIIDAQNFQTTKTSLSDILACLESELGEEVVSKNGFYALSGRREIIEQKLQNYFYGFKREKLIKKFISGLRHLPFVRGVALAGSQALGMPKANSDIDLLILTEQKFMGLARFFVTAYFQVLGRRRHGKKVANRFCLNHYIAENKIINEDKNLYSAAEYLKLRYLVYGPAIANFQIHNGPWIGLIFPNANFHSQAAAGPSRLQRRLEAMLINDFGRWLEKVSDRLQRRRIAQGEFIVVSADELSFHPNNRKQELFKKFFATV